MHHRKSPRASRYEYTAPWAYFVTICTKNRVHYFGEVVEGEMQLNELGKYVTDHRKQIGDHYSFVLCDEFVCMPNHVHGIIIIGEHEKNNHAAVGTNVSTGLDINVGIDVGTQFLASYKNIPYNNPISSNNPIIEKRTDENPSPQARCQSGSLGAIIRGFKIWITKYANTHHIPFAWQSRYHDHIIRNQKAYDRIRWYIQQNPKNRKKDCFWK